MFTTFPSLSPLGAGIVIYAVGLLTMVTLWGNFVFDSRTKSRNDYPLIVILCLLSWVGVLLTLLIRINNPESLAGYLNHDD